MCFASIRLRDLSPIDTFFPSGQIRTHQCNIAQNLFKLLIIILFSRERDPVTLTRFILNEQKKYPEASGELTIILTAIQTACKSITSSVRRAGLQVC